MSSFISKSTLKALDTTDLFLLYSAQYTHLPELYDVFGGEHLLKFLEIFSGTTIKVPPMKDIERGLRNVAIYSTLSKQNTKPVRETLARDYDISEDQIEKIYSETSAYFAGLLKPRG